MSGNAVSISDLDVSKATSIPSVSGNESLDVGERQTLVPLSFKVTKIFKKRYQQAALDADMKLNELLMAMLNLWESRKPTS